jgi:tRNA (guanine-N7-)-methyltransferase
VGKNKIARWAELDTFSNVIQPETGEVSGKDHRIKGNWNRDIFKNSNPVILELGCGKGEYTVGLAGLFPDSNFIGVDIKGARMWRGAKTASEEQLKNVAFLRTRIEFINSFFAANEVDEIWITFPDPHPGKKNSNKRLTCPWFLNIYRNFIKEKGIIHLKTDNTELYDYTRKLVTDNGLEILFATNDMNSMHLNDLKLSGNVYPLNSESGLKENISARILSIRTHYEAKFLEKGMSINYLAFRLEKNKSICYEWERTKTE